MRAQQTPRDTWNTICTGHAEVVAKTDNFQFPGAGQRATPVTDVQGLVELINLLPGQNAARFRSGGARLLVRFLGGDESLVPEVQAIAAHHESGASAGTFTQLFHEAVHTDTAAVPPPPTRPALPEATHRFAFLSPSLRGRTLSDFVDKDVCYLLVFQHQGTPFIKFGSTKSVHKRMTTHQRELPGCQIYFMLHTPHSRRLKTSSKAA